MIEKLPNNATCKEHLAKVNEIIEVLNNLEDKEAKVMLDEILGTEM